MKEDLQLCSPFLNSADPQNGLTAPDGMERQIGREDQILEGGVSSDPEQASPGPWH